MSKDTQWSKYIVLGDTVNIYNSDNVLKEKRTLFPNIDDVLLLENRISFLNDCYNKNSEDSQVTERYFLYRMTYPYIISSIAIMLNHGLTAIDFDYPMAVAMSFIVGVYSSRFVLDRHKSNIIANNSHAVNRLYDTEKEKYMSIKEELLNEPIDEGKIIRNQLIPVSEDRDYGYELVGREDIFENYSKMKRKLKRKMRNDRLDEYMDSIGCTSEDKEILIELLSEKSKKLEAPKQLVKN